MGSTCYFIFWKHNIISSKDKILAIVQSCSNYLILYTQNISYEIETNFVLTKYFVYMAYIPISSGHHQRYFSLGEHDYSLIVGFQTIRDSV